MSTLWKSLFVGGTILVVVASMVPVYFGSLDAAISCFRSSDLIIQTPVVDLGECRDGESRDVELRIFNASMTQKRIVGGTTSCSCVATKYLPITIAPGEEASIPVTVHVSGKRGEFRQVVTVLADDGWLKPLRAEIHAKVVTPADTDRLQPVPDEIPADVTHRIE